MTITTLTTLLEPGGRAICPQAWLCVGSLIGVFISLLSPFAESQDQTLSPGAWLHKPWALGPLPSRRGRLVVPEARGGGLCSWQEENPQTTNKGLQNHRRSGRAEKRWFGPF